MSFSVPDKGVADNKPDGPEDACTSQFRYQFSTTLDFGQLASPFRLLSIAARWHFLFDKMILFLNNKWNFPSNTKIAPNSTNINKIEILTLLQDSFIHEEYNDIFNNKKYAAEAAQNHCLVCQRNPCKTRRYPTRGVDH